MTDHRTEMMKALKEIFVPALRERGFKGSLPHFYRSTSTRADFLTIQFNSSGGSFVVEIAGSGPSGIEGGYGCDLPINKLNTHFFRDRQRLGAKLESSDHWFVYGPRMYDPSEAVRPYAYYTKIAGSMLSLLDSQAETWWSAR